jgi:hypothetical protein
MIQKLTLTFATIATPSLITKPLMKQLANNIGVQNAA